MKAKLVYARVYGDRVPNNQKPTSALGYLIDLAVEKLRLGIFRLRIDNDQLVKI